MPVSIDWLPGPDVQKKPLKTQKYFSKSIVIDGYTFRSLKEGRRYGELVLLQKAGQIRDLEVHSKALIYRFTVQGYDGKMYTVGRYTPDFRYVETATNERIIEDVKGGPTRTEAYQMRKRMMRALFGIEIRET